MSLKRIGSLIAVALVAGASMWPATNANAGGGCHGPATQGTGDTVALAQACFGPSVLQVDPGTKVRFVNKDPVTHNVSATGWGSPGDLQQGDAFTTTFEDEGTYPYACMYHYGMTGAIVVGDGSGPASGEPLEVGSVLEATPLAQEQSDVAAVTEQSRVTGWAVAGIAGVILGAGLTSLIHRRRTGV